MKIRTLPYGEPRRLSGLPKQIVLVMKLTTILILAAALQVSARGYSQTVTIARNNIALGKIFRDIHKQTGYNFLCTEEQLSHSKKVDIDLKAATLEEALNMVFKDQPLTYSIINKTIIVRHKPTNDAFEKTAIIQPIHITGVVKDAGTGQPLAGVTIQVKGNTMGTATDAEGKFALDVSANAVLEVSFLGYSKEEVQVNGNTFINIDLKPSTKNLNELIVVGYGTQKKVDLTGAVSQVSGKRLQDRPITNVSEGLQGIMANLNVYTTYSGGTPGATKSINIRGYTGLGSSASPLILVDGVPADINSINPDDIASITVLKDAASSAIYGSRAPYGVILIKTKEGGKDQPMTLSLNSNVSFSQPIDVPKMMNSLQFVTLYNEAFKNAGQPAGFTDDVIQRIKQYMADPNNTPTTIKSPNNPAAWESWFGSNANNDWFNVYLKRWSPSQQHNVSLTGGGNKLTYYMGLGYMKKNGMFNFFHDYYDRYNMRANVNANVNKWLTLSLKTSYSQEYSTEPYAGADIGYNWFHQIPRRFPTVPVKDPNGHYTIESYIPEIENGGRDIGKNNDSWITGEIKITPLSGWLIDANYSYNYSNGAGTTTQLPYTVYNALNQPVPAGFTSQLWKTDNTGQYHTYNIFTSYERQLGNHYFKALVGYQQEYKAGESLSGHNSNLYSNGLPSLSLTYGNNYSASDNLWAWATEGLFMRFNYNYKEKFLFEFNGRYDGSSLFPKDSRYAFFPSFSAGYNIARETFWQSVTNKITTLKLRASYGILGDVSTLLDAKNYYPYQNTLSTVPPNNTNWEFGNGREPYVQVGGLHDPNITWAKPSMLDFGIDIGAFNERLQTTFDWYRRKTTDLFGPAEAYPGILGVSPPQKNNASIQTKGFDLTVSWQDHIGKVGYSARFVFSNYKGTVLSYPNPNMLINNWYNGEVMGSVWGYTAVDLFHSQAEINKSAKQTQIWSNWRPGDVHYKDLNGDGVINWGNNTVKNPGDQSVIGNSTPQFAYGFNFEVNWKGFDLSAFIQGIGKRSFWSGSNYFWGITGNKWQGSPLTTQLNRYGLDSLNGYFPNYYMSNEMSKNMSVSTRYLLNAAYFRVKNLQIGYTLPEELTQKVHISRLRIYGSVENLFTVAPGLHNKFQVDPELLQSDSKIYPIQRTFSVGLNLNLQ
jgi:TonB-linked SusC/RagA family outer membrane protein